MRKIIVRQVTHLFLKVLVCSQDFSFQDRDQDQDSNSQDQDQDQDFRYQDQDQDQDLQFRVSRRLETKTRVSRTTTLQKTVI
jgi:hypothetical protein